MITFLGQEMLSCHVSLYPISKCHNFSTKKCYHRPHMARPKFPRHQHQEGSTIQLSCETSLFDVAPRTTGGGLATTWQLHIAINKEGGELFIFICVIYR